VIRGQAAGGTNTQIQVFTPLLERELLLLHHQAGDDAKEISIQTEQLASLREAKDLLHAAERFRTMRAKVRADQADFEDKGYSAFPYRHPLSGKTVTLDWHDQRDASLAWFENLAAELDNHALDEVLDAQQVLASVEVKPENLDQALAVSRLRIDALTAKPKFFEQVQDRLQREVPQGAVYAANNGVFRLELPAGNYTLVGTNRDVGVVWVQHVGGEQEVTVNLNKNNLLPAPELSSVPPPQRSGPIPVVPHTP
jgi:hypothetical protein